MTFSHLSNEMKQILDSLAVEDAGLPDPTQLPPKMGREQASNSNKRWNQNLPEMAHVQDVSIAGPGEAISCRVLIPTGTLRGTIFFIHGGGWAFCSMETHERCARVLANEAQASVVMCDYRLAPENPYPAGLEDCIAVWSVLTSDTGPLSHLKGPFAVSGDSAGANLAMALMLRDVTKPDCALLFYGVYEADFNSPSYVDCADGPGLSRDKLMRYWDWYAPESARADPTVAPLAASNDALMALPPLYLNAAEIDPLRSDSERMFARLSGLGRKDRFRLHGGVVHGFMQMTLTLEEARLALVDAGRAFRNFTDGAD